jgi:hypothetical protein
VLRGAGCGSHLGRGRAKVIVFEKQRSLGGTSNFFQGAFAVEGDIQRERYIDYTRGECFKNTMEYSHCGPGAGPGRLASYVRPRLLTIDEVGFLPLDSEQCHLGPGSR